ncbi:hypothetical protein NST50_08715 [Paenibacillus sp. FSL E2-0202]|uniref:hypothetical protein n=1 Tax=Paenibacillus sp. FSL E2-0202 TaxID=2954505 RepID=UPI0030ED637E
MAISVISAMARSSALISSLGMNLSLPPAWAYAATYSDKAAKVPRQRPGLFHLSIWERR